MDALGGSSIDAVVPRMLCRFSRPLVGLSRALIMENLRSSGLTFGKTHHESTPRSPESEAFPLRSRRFRQECRQSYSFPLKDSIRLPSMT